MSTDTTKPQGVCPVDHTTREAWIRNAGSNQKPLLEDKLNQQQQVPAPHPVPAGADEAKCPVDHESRAVWLQNGGEGRVNVENCSSDRLGSNFSTPSTAVDSTGHRLSTEREISTIPRASTGDNWVYPSQQQFFTAMQRKNWDPSADDMKTVVPIHNAVNERAWTEILKWEQGEGGESCGGPQLIRFQGDSKKITPKARFNMIFGYQKPFDRHDWLVDRCGTQVEYVLDFYSGKPNPLMPDMPSFYIDVRPKLNSIEGCRMRLFKWFGLK
ncbi:uncharacterized protein SAPINGB_P003977 [Magnusiomyces paraingens]|uniref:Holocytochrome c-type synthase n=1 Tax=Magnusiomyces paraingens TaxID=2606893 RepID=A0A5E8BT59_9ASCO|nr:uncharacterized protein SAPINGB_P003977 [Saprochaete ingens]VVT54241.1 unnamed protein product [Saprochaete ingens]